MSNLDIIKDQQSITEQKKVPRWTLSQIRDEFPLSNIDISQEKDLKKAINDLSIEVILEFLEGKGSKASFDKNSPTNNSAAYIYAIQRGLNYLKNLNDAKIKEDGLYAKWRETAGAIREFQERFPEFRSKNWLPSREVTKALANEMRKKQTIEERQKASERIGFIQTEMTAPGNKEYIHREKGSIVMVRDWFAQYAMIPQPPSPPNTEEFFFFDKPIETNWPRMVYRMAQKEGVYEIIWWCMVDKKNSITKKWWEPMNQTPYDPIMFAK